MAGEGESISEAYDRVLETFKMDALKDCQRKALESLIKDQDVFVIQPTGSGKSLIFQSAPIVFDIIKPPSRGRSIVIVISPLVSLMEDQVRFLKSVGMTAEFIGDDQKDEEAKKRVEQGDCQIVYGSPEAFLSSKRWRAMLSGDVYRERLCLVAVDEAHCISHWGYTAKKGEKAFRKWFGRINEIRSIVGKVPVLALTATATTSTRVQIMQSLEMKKPVLLLENPDRPNIAYAVKVVAPSPSKIFQKMVQDIREHKGQYDRTIVYCQSIKAATELYGFFQAELGKDMYTDETLDPRKRIVEMFHSRIDDLNRDEIIKSMGMADGCIRVLIATIAYGMGIDCKEVKVIIHYGPSKNLEAYMQESGRAGRKSTETCKSILLYSSLMMKYCHEDIKTYVKNASECRRKTLLANFDAEVSNSAAYEHPHQCCDICQANCKCLGSSCGFVYFDMPSQANEQQDSSVSQSRTVTDSERERLATKLQYLKRAVNEQYVKAARQVNIPIFTPAKLHCTFGDTQVEQILGHCEDIYSVVDIYKYVDIWNVKVAEEVLFVFSQVFTDVNVSISEDELECEEIFDFVYLDNDIFDFENEDSFLADIPHEFFSIVEDSLSQHGDDSDID